MIRTGSHPNTRKILSTPRRHTLPVRSSIAPEILSRKHRPARAKEVGLSLPLV